MPNLSIVAISLAVALKRVLVWRSGHYVGASQFKPDTSQAAWLCSISLSLLISSSGIRTGLVVVIHINTKPPQFYQG